jgi:gliding motility-associated-like protein
LDAAGTPNDFSSMDWADCNNGIVVGSNGTFGKTSDGGKTWVDNSNNVFAAAQIGFGKVIYPAINKMYFSSFNSLYTSPDQGSTIDVIFTEPNANGQIKGFSNIGQDKIWMAGYRSGPTTAQRRSLIFRTVNASAVSPVWDTVGVFPTGTFVPQLNNIKFANQDTGYVCATRGKVYRTINGGSNWTDVSPDTTVNSNGTNNYSGLSVVNGKTIFVGGSSKKLFKSTDAGATWTDLTLVLSTPSTISAFSSLSIIEMNDVNNGYMMAGNFLLKTSDGWATWTYDIPPLGISSMMLYPKMSGPVANKKLMFTTLQASTFVNSQISATILEYGVPALVNVASTETVASASCTNTTAGSITINAAGGILPYTYSINGGTPQSSNVFSGLTQGAKTIVIRDAGCQVVTKTVTVPFNDNLTLTTNNDTLVCAGAPVQMLSGTNGAGSTFSWSPSTGLTNANISNPVATVTANRAFIVTASLNGCVRTKTVNVNIKPNPIISAGPDLTILDGDVTILQGNGASNPQSILWTPATGLLNGATTYIATVQPRSTTTYTLTVKDQNNCTSTDAAVVTVINNCAKISDAFTPNGDGVNERWIISTGTSCYTQAVAAVYNRYGGLVYKNDNYQNNWDGTYSGKPVADGTYYYTVTFKLINGRSVSFTGDVTILR